MSLRYESGGRRMSKNQFFDDLRQSVIDNAVQQAMDKLQSVRCAFHGQRPKVTPKVNGEKVSLMIDGCCQDLIDKAKAKLG